MAQNKLKIKTKVPMKTKNKSVKKLGSKKTNRPIPPRKCKNVEVKKLKKIVTKTVNSAVEAEIQALAKTEGKQKLSKTQKKIAELNSKT